MDAGPRESCAWPDTDAVARSSSKSSDPSPLTSRVQVQAQAYRVVSGLPPCFGTWKIMLFGEYAVLEGMNRS